jgi:hypothetical protein
VIPLHTITAITAPQIVNANVEMAPIAIEVPVCSCILPA